MDGDYESDAESSELVSRQNGLLGYAHAAQTTL